MGCYAAINALKSAHHIVRSVPEAAVLVLNLELCLTLPPQNVSLSELL
jgi:predicted naringenin-chalcone synthase